MNGLRAVLGWDNIDVMLCKMHGFETVTIKRTLGKTSSSDWLQIQISKSMKKLGEYFYNLGLNFPLAAISSERNLL